MSLSLALDKLQISDASPAEKLRDALSLYDTGVEIQQLNFKRRHPGASDEELKRLLEAWLAREDEI